MTEEGWPANVPRSKRTLNFDRPSFDGPIFTTAIEAIHKIFGPLNLTDGPRPFICADCGSSNPGPVFHLKPETYAIIYRGETFYLERHIGTKCGCAKKRNLG